MSDSSSNGTFTNPFAWLTREVLLPWLAHLQRRNLLWYVFALPLVAVGVALDVVLGVVVFALELAFLVSRQQQKQTNNRCLYFRTGKSLLASLEHASFFDRRRQVLYNVYFVATLACCDRFCREDSRFYWPTMMRSVVDSWCAWMCAFRFTTRQTLLADRDALDADDYDTAKVR